MRHSKTSPGGPHVSEVKKQRVKELKNTYGDKRRGQSNHGPRNTGDRGGLPPLPNPSLDYPPRGEFPYNLLDDAVKGTSLSAYFSGIESSVQAASADSGSNQSSWRSGGPSFLDSCVQELLSTKRSLTAETRAAAGQRVVDKTILLDNPIKTGSEKQEAGLTKKPLGYAAKLARRRKGKPCIIQQLKHKQLPRKSAISYCQLEMLHAMWKTYMNGLLSPVASPAPTSGSAAASAAAAAPAERLLVQAELHGCLLRVEGCRDVCHVGVRGIVAAITKQFVCVVSSDDDLHVVPVRGSVFQYEVPGGRHVTLHGTAWQQGCS